jgi:hypothetical protein
LNRGRRARRLALVFYECGRGLAQESHSRWTTTGVSGERAIGCRVAPAFMERGRRSAARRWVRRRGPLSRPPTGKHGETVGVTRPRCLVSTRWAVARRS